MTHFSVTQGLVGMLATFIIGTWTGWKMRCVVAYFESKRRENEE